MSGDIFISYTTRDKWFVDRILDLFNKNDISYWFAPNDICAGQRHTQVIIPAIKKTKIFMVFLSKYTRPYGINNSDISGNVLDEISVAKDEKKYFLPIKLDETVDYPSDDLLFQRLGNYVDFHSNSFDLASSQLIDIVNKLLENDNYLNLESSYVEVIRNNELNFLKEIENAIKSNSINTASDLIFNNLILRKNHSEKIKLFETIILMSKKHIKDLTSEEIDLIYENLAFLQKTDFLNYALYLEALVLESYFNFNCIKNNKTRDLNVLKKLAQEVQKIKTVDYRLFQSIKTVNNHIKIEWMKI